MQPSSEEEDKEQARLQGGEEEQSVQDRNRNKLCHVPLMDRPPASAVSAFFCVPRVSAVSAANSSATPRMLFIKLGSMNTVTAREGRGSSAVSGSPVFPLPCVTAV